MTGVRGAARAPSAAPSYRARLRVEGWTLAAAGGAGVALLLALTPQATRGPLSTIAQLAALAVLLGYFAPRSARRWLAAAAPIDADAVGSGLPTALWKLPLIVGVLTVAVGVPAGWDAGLRVSGGCVLVGLAQCVLIERVVAADERRNRRRYFRQPGSRVLRGTRLGYRTRA